LVAPILAAMISSAVIPIVAITAHAQQMTPCDFQSQGDYSGSYAKVHAQGPFEIAKQEIVAIESDIDGATIQIGLVKPQVPKGMRVPVIAAPSVYYHPLQTMDLRACRPFLTENYVPHGYAVAFLPVRGTADSGGCMEMMGPKERADIDQAITWLGKQPWSTGNVGMIGKSYDGAAQWEAAAFGNPYLKTIVPLSGVPDLFELLYGDGIVDWRGPAVLNGIYYLESAGFYAPGRSPEHTVEVSACPTYAEGLAASTYSGATGELDPLGYWADRRYIDDILKNYRGSVYLVQGLQDWNVNPAQQYPWIWELEKRGVYVKHLLGQWGHSWPYDGGSRMDWADILLNWWDRWLRGEKHADLGPRVQVEDNTGLWRNAARWPSGKDVTFHLNPEHKLGEKASSESATEMVANDPFHTQLGYSSSMPPEGMESQCMAPTCTYFESAPVTGDFRISGLPEIDLTVVPRGPGGQLSAYLYAATDDGYERIGWAQSNLRFPGEADEAKDVTPGAKLEVAITMQPLDAVVTDGGRLVLMVSGGTAWNRLPVFPNFPVEILEGEGLSTMSLVGATPRAGDFFKPPE
jgi:putative CocE/NonD family hydrolase